MNRSEYSGPHRAHMGGCIAAQSPPETRQMIWRDLFVFAGLLFKSKAPQNLLRASVCGSKLRIRCCVLLYLDLTWARIGRRTSETTSLPPIWPKTGRRILRPDSKQVGDSPSPTCLRRLMRSLITPEVPALVVRCLVISRNPLPRYSD